MRVGRRVSRASTTWRAQLFVMEASGSRTLATWCPIELARVAERMPSLDLPCDRWVVEAVPDLVQELGGNDAAHATLALMFG